LSWEIAIQRLISLHALLQVGVDAHGYGVVDGKGTPDVDTLLILHQRHVQERAIYHVKQQLFLFLALIRAEAACNGERAAADSVHG
jgi:hypothetical protein